MKIISLLILVVACSHQPKTVIAHRGASGYLPEHTLESATMAHSFGVDFIEPDVVITKDNKAVLLHNIHLDQTTDVAVKFPKRKRKDGRYYVVDFTLKEIKSLNVYDSIDPATGKLSYPPRFPYKTAKFEVPTLQEFIELVQGLNKTRGKNIGIYPELKMPEFHTKNGKDIAKLVLPILESYGYNSADANIYLQCFYPPTLKRLKTELGAKMKLVALIAENDWAESSADYNYYKSEAGVAELSQYVDGYGPWINQLMTKEGKDTGLVAIAHKYGLKVHPYTHRTDMIPSVFKTEEEFFDFFFGELNIDGIFSDFSDRAMKYAK